VAHIEKLKRIRIMNANAFKRFGIASALGGALALTACGGGGFNEVVDPIASAHASGGTIPDSALSSAQGFTSYVLSIFTRSENSEPMTMNAHEPPVSDDTEPRDVQ
jgi:hypothetical protein